MYNLHFGRMAEFMNLWPGYLIVLEFQNVDVQIFHDSARENLTDL
jgi:hypothetical protein